MAFNNAMRSVLPDLLALSASSPWYEGRYTHLHSTRSQLFTRMFPRCGIPEPFDGWADYDSFVRWLVDTRSIREHTEIWWCVRPHQSYGTVELRNADALADVRESLAVMAYAYALSARRLRAIDEGEQLPELRGRHIEENMWRAIRFGLSGELIDYERGMASVPAAERVRAQLADAAAEVAALGLEPYLEPLQHMLDHGNSAQRSIAALEAGVTLEELFADQVRVTRDLPFMSQCSAGDVTKSIDFGPGYEPHVHIKWIKGMQLMLRKCLIDASGPNPIEAFIKYMPPEPLNFTNVRSTLRLYNGKPQLLLESNELHDFMILETQLIALEGAKVVVCEHCGNLFLTGSGTGRRIHAVHCSDRCRVAATRARKRGGE